MSSAVFPTFIGQAYPNRKTPKWSTIQQNNTSGKQTRIGLWSYPKYLIRLDFNVLRSNLSYTEQQQLQGFFNSRNGAFDSFLWQDPHDNTVAAQNIGTGDGATRTFQLVRTYGGFVEPVFAPNVVATVYDNGTPVSGANYSVSAWGTTTPGVVTFGVAHAPAAGHAVTADFTYYWPVHFMDDNMSFDEFMNLLYECRGVTLETIK